MPRGGRRQGSPGKPYPNRTDIAAQPVSVPPARVQGDRQRQEAAQRAIPLPATSPPQLTPMDAPSGRPGEPVTAGLPIGAGAGPEALPFLGGVDDDDLAVLKRLYSVRPVEQLRRIIERLEIDLGF